MQKIFLVIALLALISGCNEAELKTLREENAQLRSKIEVLIEENRKLKETAEFHFQTGQEYMQSKNWESAASEFQTVLDKYPNDPLNEYAKSMLSKAKDAISEEQAKQAKELAESGEPIDYGLFYAKSKTGMNVDKRYRFVACINQIPCFNSSDPSIRTRQNICSVSPQFDDPSEYERWLSGGQEYCGEMVAGMQWGGRIAVYRLH
jgi:tetratricopeptide (TPR) repeat protein